MAAFDEKSARRDKDPKIAAKRKIFLKTVDEVAHSHAKSLNDGDTPYIAADPGATFEQLVELDYRFVFDHGYESAKLGASDEEIAKSFKEAVMARVKVNEKKADDERNAEEARKKARENWK